MINFTKEYAESCIGELIGKGNLRKVYQHSKDKTLVIKQLMWSEVGVDRDFGFQNQNEYKVWNKATDKFKKVLCPVLDMTKCGEYLLMKKAVTLDFDFDLEKIYRIRDRFPEFIMDDIHAKNVGFYKGNLVLIDYGSINRFSINFRGIGFFRDWIGEI